MATKKWLSIVVDGNSAMGPCWSKILSYNLERIVRTFFNNLDGEGIDLSCEVSLILYNFNSSIGTDIQYIKWTKNVDQFLSLMKFLPFNGNDLNQHTAAKGLAEALVMFPKDGMASSEYFQGERHCILVATGNPVAKKIQVSLPMVEKGKFIPQQYKTLDATFLNVARMFVPFKVSLSVITPSRHPAFISIFNLGNDLLEEDSVTDYGNGQLTVFLSRKFKEAHYAHSNKGIVVSASKARVEPMNPTTNAALPITFTKKRQENQLSASSSTIVGRQRNGGVQNVRHESATSALPLAIPQAKNKNIERNAPTSSSCFFSRKKQKTYETTLEEDSLIQLLHPEQPVSLDEILSTAGEGSSQGPSQQLGGNMGVVNPNLNAENYSNSTMSLPQSNANICPVLSNAWQASQLGTSSIDNSEVLNTTGNSFIQFQSPSFPVHPYGSASAVAGASVSANVGAAIDALLGAVGASTNVDAGVGELHGAVTTGANVDAGFGELLGSIAASANVDAGADVLLGAVAASANASAGGIVGASVNANADAGIGELLGAVAASDNVDALLDAVAASDNVDALLGAVAASDNVDALLGAVAVSVNVDAGVRDLLGAVDASDNVDALLGAIAARANVNAGVLELLGAVAASDNVDALLGAIAASANVDAGVRELLGAIAASDNVDALLGAIAASANVDAGVRELLGAVAASANASAGGIAGATVNANVDASVVAGANASASSYGGHQEFARNHQFEMSEINPLGTPAMGASTWASPVPMIPQYNQTHLVSKPPMDSENFVQAWEGCLVGKIHPHRPFLNQVKALRRLASPVTLTEEWSSRLDIALFLPKKAVSHTMKFYGGPIDQVLFQVTQFNNLDLYEHLMSNDLCAKIVLPFHTLILSTTENKLQYLGSIFPGDTVFLEPL